MSSLVSLDGTWEFFPGATELRELDTLVPQPIRVPALWEAQGYLDLDGVAWYRRTFEVDDADGFWTVRVGAAMDIVDVFLNGSHLGSHDGAFTPFELDATAALLAGENVVAMRVVDPPLGDPEHARMPHGKQGWANDVFPSRPSLYMTYGGIWQSVTLHRHGPVIARDVFVDGNPDALGVSVDLVNRSNAEEHVRMHVSTLVQRRTLEVVLAPHERRAVAVGLGAVDAARWTPERPLLHELEVDVEGSERQVVRYGLRTVRIEGRRILVNGEPYRMKSALVQGFHDEALYAEGDRAAIVAEVTAAKRMGFNTLRLHIKAFDPTYLDVCDELGMLLHCDLPLAEPVDYGELARGTALARRSLQAAREQVRRDRNHPSIILWSAMNEIGEHGAEIRASRDYEGFARDLVAEIDANDGTRPVIENDWMEFSGSSVYASPILTAHWYGRLHRDYLDEVDKKLVRWAADARVLLVSEFGDWGLPDMPEAVDPPFWDARAKYVAAVAESLWPDSIERFVEETQRYQGVSDRLQAEAFRRHDRVSGYCLTELTDVPQELNGLVDIHRNPKPAAVAELTRANQVVLPMLDVRSFVAVAGEPVRARLHVANDGQALHHVTVEANGALVYDGDLGAHCARDLGEVVLAPPTEPGPHEVDVQLRASGKDVAANAYMLRVVPPPRVDVDVDVCVVGDGDGATRDVLETLGARTGGAGPAVVPEWSLSRHLTRAVAERLERGETVLVLAQPPEEQASYPVDVQLRGLDTRSGSSAFTFTTRRAALAAFPDCGVLVGEDATIHALGMVERIDGRPYPTEPIVVRFNAMASAGTIVGAHRAGRGRLLFCQYRLVGEARAGDAAARSLLCDLVRLLVA